jgi:hypothetical protein
MIALLSRFRQQSVMPSTMGALTFHVQTTQVRGNFHDSVTVWSGEDPYQYSVGFPIANVHWVLVTTNGNHYVIDDPRLGHGKVRLVFRYQEPYFKAEPKDVGLTPRHPIFGSRGVDVREWLATQAPVNNP